MGGGTLPLIYNNVELVGNMGFSLQAFFNDLLAIIDGAGTEEEKYLALADEIRVQAKYAEECGQISTSN